MDLFRLSIPIVAIVLSLCVALWAIYWDHQTKRLQYEERRLMIEKGMAPPPIVPGGEAGPIQDDLRRGIILIAIGAGLGTSYFLFGGGGPWRVLLMAAPIVGLLGVGFLLYYFMARGRADADQRPSPR